MLEVAKEALRAGRTSTLAECFRRELDIVSRCIEEGDFVEGVRAHLVDKDRQPSWRPASLSDVSPLHMQSFLSSSWQEHDHPLSDLESNYP
jgi:hypothetical protein